MNAGTKMMTVRARIAELQTEIIHVREIMDLDTDVVIKELAAELMANMIQRVTELRRKL